ncbi:MAG: protein phosphatase 2C domain-containing protein [Actinomycetaceae bacterium]|nr:protein phosphatase 2C domain-containing protein [Actinomycetaceae bacterium]MDY5854386.1 protein phosphatase 2C domain-containing protein [Arcanobacterium sp.]
MSISFNYVALSDIGLVRSTNQDAGYASQHLLVLADGMGGAAAGDIASSVTVAHLAQVDDSHAVDDLLPTLRTALMHSQQELAERVSEDPSIAGLGTTCIAIMRSSNKLAMTHIGDSRAYLLRGDKFTQVTHDHTLVQYLVDHGELTPEEAAHHPKRNVIMRAISDTPESVDVDESIREAIPGDRWLLCSDGLFGVVSNETLKATLSTYKNLNECGEVLISLALAGGAPDNVTVVLADVVDDAMLPRSVNLPSEPMIVGSAATDYSRPSRGSTSAAGKAAALLKRDGRRDSDTTTKNQRSRTDTNADAHGDVRGSKARRFFGKLGVALLVLGVLAAGLWAGYSWTQTQYYVAPNGGYVGIYRGIPQEIGPLSLYHLEETTGLQISELNSTAQDRLTTPITRSSLSQAREVVENLRAQRVTRPAAAGQQSKSKQQDRSGQQTPTSSAPVPPASPAPSTSTPQTSPASRDPRVPQNPQTSAQESPQTSRSEHPGGE